MIIYSLRTSLKCLSVLTILSKPLSLSQATKAATRGWIAPCAQNMMENCIVRYDPLCGWVGGW